MVSQQLQGWLAEIHQHRINGVGAGAGHQADVELGIGHQFTRSSLPTLASWVSRWYCSSSAMIG